MAQRRNIRDRLKKSLGTEQELNESIVESKTPEVTLSGGVYRASKPTYTDGDNAILHTDINGNLFVVQSGTVSSTVGDGRKEVTTAGTRETLASSTVVKEVTITAELNNTGVVVVGGVTCVAAEATRRGTPLYSGDSITIATDNLAEVYVDSTVSTEGVTYSFLG